MPDLHLVTEQQRKEDARRRVVGAAALALLWAIAEPTP